MSPDTLGDREQVRRFIESVRCLTEDYMRNEGDYGPGGKLEGRGYKADVCCRRSITRTGPRRSSGCRRTGPACISLWKYIQIKRGDNDIYTPVSSQLHDTKYVMNRGILDGEEWCAGVHHMAFTGSLNQANPGFGQEQFWIDLVADLRERGF